ncbi:MAG TPA: S8 family serine peptidase [Thermoanaerobaculaceae bacterium]|nr:S8 family serine peptidase [Thermoanaerobaculaceae bacterium]
MRIRQLMARLIPSALLALTVAAAAPAATVGPGVAETIGRDGHARVVVMLHVDEGAASSRTSILDAVASVQARVLDALSADELQLATHWRLVPGFGGRLSASGLAKLADDPLVDRVDLDVSGHAHLAVSVPLVRGNLVQTAGYTGQGVTVAILDSGITRTHADFAGKIVDEQCFCEDSYGNGCCPNGATSQSGTGAARDDNGHGTNVAGIVASKGVVSAKGMAPNAGIVAVRVLQADGRFYSSSQVVSGLDWVATHHPEVKALNMSLGTEALFSGTCDGAGAASWITAFATAINRLRNGGTLTVVSAGNQSSLQQMAVPACVSNAIAVGAVYKANVGPYDHSSWAGCSDATTAADKVVCFSNSSTALDLLAPGSPITASGMNGGTSTYSGTSQAAPHVAGTVALLAQAVPAATPSQIEQVLKSTGVAVTDQRNGRQTPRIDAKSALDALKGTAQTSSLWIPVASHVGGSFNSQWRTDLGMLNTGTTQSNVELRLYTTSGVKTKTTFVTAGAQSILDDVAGQIGYSGSGALEVRFDQALRVNSRTYNLVAANVACYPNGTFGQSYEAYRVQDGLSAGQSAYLAGLRESSAYRTNIGLANFGPGQATATVTLYNGAGGFLASYDVTLNTGDWKQETRPFFTKAQQTNMTRGYAKVTVNTGSGVVALGSVLDNLTNDPTTVLPIR